ncbi:MAG: putative Ig domain-containing protein, partial [Granulosicoccus sp.]
GVVFTENLSLYFSDPEQGDLTYSLAPGFDLPEGSGISLQKNGVLSGIPVSADIGTYSLKLVISDGGQEIDTLFVLIVSGVTTGSRNSIPEYVEGSVADRTLFLGAALTPITPEFTDEDDDTLTYSLSDGVALPAGVTIDDKTGVITGRPLARTWVRDLRVIATDPLGFAAISEPFFIRVR